MCQKRFNTGAWTGVVYLDKKLGQPLNGLPESYVNTYWGGPAEIPRLCEKLLFVSGVLEIFLEIEASFFQFNRYVNSLTGNLPIVLICSSHHTPSRVVIQDLVNLAYQLLELLPHTRVKVDALLGRLPYIRLGYVRLIVYPNVNPLLTLKLPQGCYYLFHRVLLNLCYGLAQAIVPLFTFLLFLLHLRLDKDDNILLISDYIPTYTLCDLLLLPPRLL
jgi:hypothetical protein